MKKIPKTVMGLGGPISIKKVKKMPKVDGKKCVGTWDRDERTIELVDRKVKLMKRTLYHELFHAAVDDSGLGNLLSPAAEEAFCDMVAMARMVEDDSLTNDED